MSAPDCPHCGSLLLPGDVEVCPSCRQLAPRPAPDAVLVLLVDEAAGSEPLLAGRWFEPREEALYHDARTLLLGPEKAGTNGLLILGLTLALFAISMRGAGSPRTLLILIGVLFFHELGHWLGMQLFGYRDVKMFFIPFFGAAVSGKKEGAPQWQQAIVLLLGPLPGIIVGCALLFANLVVRDPLAQQVGMWLVGINAFNLLPLVPLDGGRLLNLLVFSRSRALESAFLVVTALGVIGLGALLHTYLFIALGALGLMVVPAQYRNARAADALRRRWPAVPARLADAGDSFLRDLFAEARRSLRGQAPGTAWLCATVMRSVHERALIRPASLGASLGLLTVYGAGFMLSFAAVFALVLGNARHFPPH